MTNIYKNAKKWVVEHPKKFYQYAMGIIIISFVFTILQYIFFPPDFKVKSLVPSLYSKSEQYKTTSDKKMKDMEMVVKEMQTLKAKYENEGTLKTSDSIRLKYLYNQYQKLKNGL